MDMPMAVVPGTIQADGTLVLQEKLSLPAGPVQVTVVPMPDLPKDDPFWQRMQGIWAGQKARGHALRTVEEVEQQAANEGWEERMQRSERIQAEAKAAKKPGSQKP